MYENSITGGRRAIDLLSRIGTEERVGESLSPDTIVLYTRKIRQAASRLAGGDMGKLTPEMLVRDLTDRIDSNAITRATARLEKAAALFWLAVQAQNLMDAGELQYERYEAGYRDIQLLGTGGLAKRSLNTSSPSMRAFPDEAVELLSQAALRERTASLLYGYLFVRANLVVGLRPIEWLDAELVMHKKTDAFGEQLLTADGKPQTCPALRVVNAKQSEERANGERRVILLEGISEQSLSYIRRWLHAINEIATPAIKALTYYEKTKKIYDALQRAVRRTLLKKGWEGSIPTIYGTRHQAVANAKADGQDRREIAALFGHSSEETAHRHYARKFAGYTGRSMRATRESILAVREAGLTGTPESWNERPDQSLPRPEKS